MKQSPEHRILTHCHKFMQEASPDTQATRSAHSPSVMVRRFCQHLSFFVDFQPSLTPISWPLIFTTRHKAPFRAASQLDSVPVCNWQIFCYTFVTPSSDESRNARPGAKRPGIVRKELAAQDTRTTEYNQRSNLARLTTTRPHRVVNMLRAHPIEPTVTTGPYNRSIGATHGRNRMKPGDLPPFQPRSPSKEPL